MKDNPHILRYRNQLVKEGVSPDKALDEARGKWAMHVFFTKAKQARNRQNNPNRHPS